MLESRSFESLIEERRKQKLEGGCPLPRERTYAEGHGMIPILRSSLHTSEY